MAATKLPAIALMAVAFGATFPARASSLTTLYSITGSGDGTTPAGTPANIGGILYGTTLAGGAFGAGTIFEFDPATSVETVLYSFTGIADGGEYSGSLMNVGGILYGTTAVGGPELSGTVFKFDPSTGTKTIIYSFQGGTDGAYPKPDAPMVFANGSLYGTTTGGGSTGFGTVFQVDIATGTEKVLYNFAGNGAPGVPYGGLIIVGGTLYGTTLYGGPANQGTVFQIDRKTGAESMVYGLNGTSDGESPGGLTAAAGGTLYVAAEYGGANGQGTILAVDPAAGTATTLYAFKGGSDAANPVAAPVLVGNTLYGTSLAGGPAAMGTLYSIALKTGAEKLLYGFTGKNDGGTPGSTPVPVNGVLYGLASYQGLYDGGAIFQLDPKTGAETSPHEFVGAPAYGAAEGLLNAKGRIVLSQAQGGPVNRGAVVKLDPASGTAATLDSFAAAGDGTHPYAPLVQVGGAYYGTTTFGGTTGNGTVFKIDPLTGVETILHNFDGGVDGRIPAGALVYMGGGLYGATAVGGANEMGTLYKIDPATGNETILHAFAGGAEGSGPNGPLTLAKGVFYGTTVAGGPANIGTTFSFDPATGAVTTLYTFGSQTSDGSTPRAGLLNAGGILYGTTSSGGQYQAGTVFKFNPASSRPPQTLHAFNFFTEGASPTNALVAVGGTLYGTTQFGPSGYGLVFAVNRATGAETTVYTFGNGSDGGNPGSALISIGSLLYGATSTGGAANLGTVFSLQP